MANVSENESCTGLNRTVMSNTVALRTQHTVVFKRPLVELESIML